MHRIVLALAVLAGLIGLVYAIWCIERYHWAGGFDDLHPHFAGDCALIDGVPSPEDLAIDPTMGLAYLSSYDRAAMSRGAPAIGALFAFNLNSPSAEPVALATGIDDVFRPHGVSLFRGANGQRRLFVINHGRPGGSVIEVFGVESERLIHERTIGGELLTTPNNIVAVAEDRFYVTNSRRHTTGWRAWLEDALRLPWGNVVYFDGAEFNVVVPQIRFPNGIGTDHHRAQIFVASSFGKDVHVYTRNAWTGYLMHARTIPIGTRVDNIEVDELDQLWIAARGRYLGDPQPSQVVRVRRANGADLVEEIYLNDGADFARASVAGVYGRHLLIGSSRSDGFLHCTMAWDTVRLQDDHHHHHDHD